jgi:protein-tyrosine-phosphatase
MPSVLFICTANQIRSPMATALFRQCLGGADRSWRVESAGVWGRDSLPAVGQARQLLAERGVDISSHRSRMVSPELLEQFALILVMERGHKEALRVEFPHLARRVFLLSEMVGLEYDIEDPIGAGVEKYRSVMLEIERLLVDGYERIVELASS